MKNSFKIPEWARKETRAFMRDICRQLETLGLLEGADTGGLMMICANYELLLESLDELYSTPGGLFDVTPQGKRVPSAAFTAATTVQTQLIKLLREYGLTSKARASLRKLEPPEEGASPLDEFLKST